MYTITEARDMLNSPKFDVVNSLLYMDKDPEIQRSRYLLALKKFCELFPACHKVSFFSAPGRTEIAGNHTDHQQGRVIAASINLDAIAIAAPTGDNLIKIKSHGYPMIEISLEDVSQRDEEISSSKAIVRGIASRLHQLGYKTGGFNAYVTSDVLPGSGLSSSAAFEVLIATIFNRFYNDGRIENIETAKVCQYAENIYFGKPCGLMDQMASSIGGFVYIDFVDADNPYVEQLYLNPAHYQYSLCIVNTGGSHADLTEDYGTVPKDMTAVAKYFEKDVLRKLTFGDFLSEIPALRKELGDLSVLRGIHFFSENDRVADQAEALENGDFQRFRQLVLESGRSSFMYNQNVFSPRNPSEQSLSVALAISQTILGEDGAWRVHGGGFAGTIQAYVPWDLLDPYKKVMTSTFGEGSVMEVKIRNFGGVCIEHLS